MNIENAGRTLNFAKEITFFTGAGLSAESGIGTFRGENGLWDEFGKYFSTWNDLIQSIYERPYEFSKFFINFVEPILVSSPNAGHQVISSFQKIKPTNVVTQNIDDLHQQAGSTRVIELHGNLYEQKNETGNITKIQKSVFQTILEKLSISSKKEITSSFLLETLKPILEFDASKLRKPNLVMFGDPLDQIKLDSAKEMCNQCDCFVVIGTSGTVIPAAFLVDIAKINNATVISINPGEPDTKYNLSMKAGYALSQIYSVITESNDG